MEARQDIRRNSCRSLADLYAWKPVERSTWFHRDATHILEVGALAKASDRFENVSSFLVSEVSLMEDCLAVTAAYARRRAKAVYLLTQISRTTSSHLVSRSSCPSEQCAKTFLGAARSVIIQSWFQQEQEKLLCYPSVEPLHFLSMQTHSGADTFAGWHCLSAGQTVGASISKVAKVSGRDRDLLKLEEVEAGSLRGDNRGSEHARCSMFRTTRGHATSHVAISSSPGSLVAGVCVVLWIDVAKPSFGKSWLS